MLKDRGNTYSECKVTGDNLHQVKKRDSLVSEGEIVQTTESHLKGLVSLQLVSKKVSDDSCRRYGHF